MARNPHRMLMNSKLSKFLRSNIIFQEAHQKSDPAFKMYSISKTKVKLHFMKKEKRKKHQLSNKLITIHKNKEKVHMIMDTITKTVNFTSRANNIAIEATIALMQMHVTTTITRAIHNFQAFQALSFKDQMIIHLCRETNIDRS